MRILIAPDKFKSSLTAQEVCAALSRGLSNRVGLEIEALPLADGGDGTAEILGHYFKAKKIILRTNNPLGNEIESSYYLKEDLAFIELADSSGIALLQDPELNPNLTSTFGTGQQMLDAIQKGARHIYLCLGGSATNDCGIGILSALGMRFLDASHQALAPIGKHLLKIHSIDTSNSIIPSDLKITTLVDVENPLTGPQGAAYIYAEQKGADSEMIKSLDLGLKSFAALINQNYNIDIEHFVGAGAAGGVAAGLKAFTNLTIKPGFETISELLNLESAVNNADYVITGEGKIDDQSIQGKVVGGITAFTKQYNKDLILVCGAYEFEDNNPLKAYPIYTIIENARDVKDAISNADQYLENIGKSISLNL